MCAPELLTPHKLLVIEDDQNLRETLVDCLEDAGYGVSSAGSAEAGLEACKRDNFDLILSDLQMPGMSGRELLEIVKTLYADTPFLLMTGCAEFSEREVKSFGANGFFQKPFLLAELYDTIEDALGTASV